MIYIDQFYLQISLEEFWSFIENFESRKTSTCITCNYQNHKPQTKNIYILKENLILYVLV